MSEKHHLEKHLSICFANEEFYKNCYKEMYEANECLWNLEDKIRNSDLPMEELGRIGVSISLANDSRIRLKNLISKQFNESYKEEKIYK